MLLSALPNLRRQARDINLLTGLTGGGSTFVATSLGKLLLYGAVAVGDADSGDAAGSGDAGSGDEPVHFAYPREAYQRLFWPIAVAQVLSVPLVLMACRMLPTREREIPSRTTTTTTSGGV